MRIFLDLDLWTFVAPTYLVGRIREKQEGKSSYLQLRLRVSVPYNTPDLVGSLPVKVPDLAALVVVGLTRAGAVSGSRSVPSLMDLTSSRNTLL